MTIWTGNSALQVLPDSRKGQRNIGRPGSRQDVEDVGGPGPAGTAVFRTAYGPHDQLSARVRADAFRAAPDNAGQPPGLIPVYTNAGHRPDALRGAELPRSHAARGNEKPCRRDACATSGVTFYDTLSYIPVTHEYFAAMHAARTR